MKGERETYTSRDHEKFEGGRLSETKYAIRFWGGKGECAGLNTGAERKNASSQPPRKKEKKSASNTEAYELGCILKLRERNQGGLQL